MGMVENAIFCTKTKLCVLVVLIILTTIILAISLSAKDKDAEASLKLANEKLDFPTRYRVIRASESYTETMYVSSGRESIGRAEKCISCQATWTVYLLNKKEEIAVVVKKESWPWADIYSVQEQWKNNATSFKIEYGWNGNGVAEEAYVIKDSKGDEIAHTDRFPLQFGKTIILKDSKNNLTLGTIKRPAFELFPTWEVTVNKRDVVPTYLYGVFAIITTLKEVDNDDDD